MIKRNLLFISYHSSPSIIDPKEKLSKYSFAYNTIIGLAELYKISMIDFIGREKSFSKDGISYFFRRKMSNNRWDLHFKTHLNIRKMQPEIIYFHGIKYMYLLLFLLPLLKKKPKIIIQHHAEKVPNKKWKKNLIRYVDQFVEAYIFTSSEMGKEWVDNKIIYSQSKIYAQPELSTTFSYNKKVIKEKNLFIWVARLNKNKDPKTVINAFSKYLKNNTHARLIMFYSEDNMENEIKEILLINGINNQIQLKGKVKHEALEKWYQKSTYFFLGSYYEGGSAALIEAMACGCIPIVSDIPANRAITNQGKCAILFEAGNPDDLFEKLISLDKIETNIFSNNVIDFFESKLSFKALSNGLDKVIQKII